LKTKLINIVVVFYCIITINAFGQTYLHHELVNIEFIGNLAIPTSELESVIFSKESPSKFSQFLNSFSGFGSPAIYFDSLLIPSDIQAIKSLYHSNGYFKISVKYNYSLAEKEAVLTFEINEREPAYLKSFNVYGLKDKIPGEYLDLLNDFIKVDSNTIYQERLVENKKNYTINYLRDHGFMLVSNDIPSVTVDTMLNRVDVGINFTTGKRYRINEISTLKTGEGKDFVEDELLKEIVGIGANSFYSFYDIQRGQVRLYRTELFNSAIINAVISDTVGNYVPLSIAADVGMMHELTPEIIVNNEDNTFNIGIGLSFTKKNLFGDARKFTIGSSIAAQNISEFLKNPSFNDSTVFGYTDTRMIVEQPFLFGKPINTKLESYFTLQKRKNEYNSKLYGAKLSFDIEMPQFTYFNTFSTYFNIERAEYTYKKEYLINLLSISYQRITERNYTKAEADSLASLYVINELGGQLISKSTNALMGILLGTNKTDDVFFPTSGYSLSFQLEEANSIPYLITKMAKSEFNRPLYLKFLAATSVFLPIYFSNLNSFGLKLKVGQIFTYKGDKADISLNQRFYSGGSNSIRGWSTRQLVPLDPLLNLENPTQEELEGVLAKGAATGGFFTFEGSIETRNRLFGKFGSVLFIDYGNTWNDFSEFKLDQIAVAGGFGIRYYSDFAPIRFDFGIKLYDPKDNRSISSKRFWNDLVQFHIGIGEAF